MLRCLIVDDEPLAINLLKDYLNKATGLVLVKATSDVFEALKIAQEDQIDLIFLDIQMPELTGIQFMKILNGKSSIILTTAYQEYALQGFEYDVVDYLLKPFSLERFIIAVSKAKNKIEGKKPETPTASNFIFVKSEYRMVKIELKDILYLESLRDYVAIHTAKEKILTLQSLRSFEEQLKNFAFIRVHKSYIVSVEKIKAIEKKRLIIQDTFIPIGDTYLEAFWKKMPIQ